MTDKKGFTKTKDYGSYVWSKLERDQSEAFIGESIAGLDPERIKKILQASKHSHLKCIKVINKLLA